MDPSDAGHELPFVDAHDVFVAAPAAAVWRALGARIVHFTDAGALASLLGAVPRTASGTPLGEGATLPGFEVAEALPARRVRLTGRHRFSRYALTLTLEPRSGGTVLCARTHADFPGLAGRVYRGLVIGSGAHRVAVSRLLDGVRQEAEARTA
jgi:hypothetical protein